MMDIKMAKKMLKEVDYSNFVMKKSCRWQTQFQKEQRKIHTVWVETKLRLILYWLVKTIKSM